MLDIDIIHSKDYAQFFEDLKTHVRLSQQKAVLKVNQQLILLYHHIGSEILRLQEEKGWGSKVIEQLSQDLKSTFPDMKGFSVTNLKYMRQLAENYSLDEIGQQAVDQLPWSHTITILTLVKDKSSRDFYTRHSVEKGWSRGYLIEQIKNKFSVRQGKAITNFNKRLPSPFSDLAEQSLKDPYLFDFITIGKPAHEKAIENALVENIEKFLIELGAGFSFVGRQYRLTVAHKTYQIDLLFYHLKLRSYVVIELKANEFKPEHAGKLNFYLSAVDDLLRHPTDNPTIGLIICKEKDNITAEYALKNINAPIGLAEYKLGRAIPKELTSSLPTIEELEAQLNRPQSLKETSNENQ